MIPWIDLATSLKNLVAHQMEPAQVEALIGELNHNLDRAGGQILTIWSRPDDERHRLPMFLVEDPEGMYSLCFKPGKNLPRSAFRLRKTSENPYSSIVLSINGFEFEVRSLFLIDDVVGHHKLFSKFEEDCIAGAMYQAAMMTDRNIQNIVSEAELQEYFDAWRRMLGLHSADETRKWMQEQGVTVLKVRDYILQKLFVAKIGGFFGEVADFFLETQKAYRQKKAATLPDEPIQLAETPLVLALQQLITAHQEELFQDMILRYFETHQPDFDEICVVTGLKSSPEIDSHSGDCLARFSDVEQFKLSNVLRLELGFELAPDLGALPQAVSYQENGTLQTALVLQIQPARFDSNLRWKILELMYRQSLRELKKVISAEFKFGSRKLFDQAGYLHF